MNLKRSATGHYLQQISRNQLTKRYLAVFLTLLYGSPGNYCNYLLLLESRKLTPKQYQMLDHIPM
jgi:hypothetical protein